MVELSTGAFAGMIVALIIGVALITAGVTFFIVKKLFEKQLKDNPPITEKMIRVMFLQMGRKPSEQQIRNVMRSMQNAKKEK